MKYLSAAFGGLVLALMAVPVSANHGLNGRLVATLENNQVLEAKLLYVSGNFDEQTWAFSWIDVTSSSTLIHCDGFGSIEVGFTAVAPCGAAFQTGGTGEFHAFPYNQPEIKEISLTYNGVAGKAQQILYPDNFEPPIDIGGV